MRVSSLCLLQQLSPVLLPGNLWGNQWKDSNSSFSWKVGQSAGALRIAAKSSRSRDSIVTLDSFEYELAGFHAHVPAEHYFLGNASQGRPGVPLPSEPKEHDSWGVHQSRVSSLEFHLVHKPPLGSNSHPLAAVALTFLVDAPEEKPTDNGGTTTLDPIRLSDIIQGDAFQFAKVLQRMGPLADAVSYVGSLTTSPYTPSIRFFFLRREMLRNLIVSRPDFESINTTSKLYDVPSRRIFAVDKESVETYRVHMQ